MNPSRRRRPWTPASSPTRGTWIEIKLDAPLGPAGMVVPHAGDVDRNITVCLRAGFVIASSPTRGTWIEMFRSKARRWVPSVVPHAGDVDRNAYPDAGTPGAESVVPHAGDVDRNPRVLEGQRRGQVVPHAGDVDRNMDTSDATAAPASRPPRGGRG